MKTNQLYIIVTILSFLTQIPVLGVDGKAPIKLDIDDNEEGPGSILASDEFNRKPGKTLPLAWQ